MAIERNLYDGVFYCRKCGNPIHVLFLIKKDPRCDCGSAGFISHLDFSINEIIRHSKEIIEEEGIEIS